MPDRKSAASYWRPVKLPGRARAMQAQRVMPGAGDGGAAGAGSAMLDRSLAYFALPSSQRRLEEQRSRVRNGTLDQLLASRSSTALAVTARATSRMWICSRAGDDAAMWLVSDFPRDHHTRSIQRNALPPRPAPARLLRRRVPPLHHAAPIGRLRLASTPLADMLGSAADEARDHQCLYFG